MTLTSSHFTNFSPSWSGFDTIKGPNDTYVLDVDVLELLLPPFAMFRGLCWLVASAYDDDDNDFVGVWCCGDCWSVFNDAAIFFWFLCLFNFFLAIVQIFFQIQFASRLCCYWDWNAHVVLLFVLHNLHCSFATLRDIFSGHWKEFNLWSVLMRFRFCNRLDSTLFWIYSVRNGVEFWKEKKKTKFIELEKCSYF